jgi:hypothetical protein
MGNYLNNLEVEDKQLSPEQRLWKAVFYQAIQDAFGISTVSMNRDEYLKSKVWFKRFTEDFIQVCENAGLDAQQTFEKLKRYDLIKQGIVWNYTTNGKRKFKEVQVVN